MADKRRKKRRARSKPPIFLVVLLIIAIVFAYVLYAYGFFDKWLQKDDGHGGQDGVIVTDDLQIHFLELGNKHSGDCTLIKVGDTEVLVDAGSKSSSASTIAAYLDNYVTDGKIEYVIATHAHEDHISALVGSNTVPGIFDRYEFGTIIDFAKTDQKLKTNAGNDTLYKKYLDKREALETGGTVHYTALDCYNNANGAQRTYELAPDITLNFLYQKFYEEKADTENNYSVCFLLSQGVNHYLFTGDLEKEGETSLVESNRLPKCKLFKAGHHGSETASNAVLIDVIQPELVCVCCCGGYREYKQTEQAKEFPSQAFCDNVTKYTDKIYVTTMYSETAEGNFASMNGNIVVSSNGGEVTVRCSASNLPFTESEWYKTYRKKAA